MLELRRGVLQLLVKVVGEDVEIAVLALKTAVDTTIVSVADTVKACGIGDRQRAQQDALHQGEDGGVSADAESERDDRCDGEPRRLAQLAQGVAHVLKKGFHGILHAHAHTL